MSSSRIKFLRGDGRKRRKLAFIFSVTVTFKLYLYIKYLWALWNSVFMLWLCKPTKTRLSAIISQLHDSVSEEGMANPRTFTVIADKEGYRQGYIEFLYLSPTFLTSCQRSLEKGEQHEFPLLCEETISEGILQVLRWLFAANSAVKGIKLSKTLDKWERIQNGTSYMCPLHVSCSYLLALCTWASYCLWGAKRGRGMTQTPC